MLERKIIEFSLDEKSFSPQALESRIMCGYAATWDEDLAGDIIHPGAFRKAILERFTNSKKARGYGRIRFMYQHTEVIGTIREIREDDKGLYIEAYFSKTHRGDEILTLVNDKALDQMSIGFIVDPQGSYQDGMGRRHITSMDVQECSVVIFPMNEDTDIMEVRSRNLALAQLVEQNRQEKVNLGNNSPRTNKEATLLDFEIKELAYRVDQIKLEVKKNRKINAQITGKLMGVMKDLHEVLCSAYPEMKGGDMEECAADKEAEDKAMGNDGDEDDVAENTKGIDSASAGALRNVQSADLLGSKNSDSNLVGENPMAMKNPSNPQTVPQKSEEDYTPRSTVPNKPLDSETSPNQEGDFKSGDPLQSAVEPTLAPEMTTTFGHQTLEGYLDSLTRLQQLLDK